MCVLEVSMPFVCSAHGRALEPLFIGDMPDLNSVPDQNNNPSCPLTASEAQQFDSSNLDPVVHSRTCSKHILQTYP